MKSSLIEYAEWSVALPNQIKCLNGTLEPDFACQLYNMCEDEINGLRNQVSNRSAYFMIKMPAVSLIASWCRNELQIVVCNKEPGIHELDYIFQESAKLAAGAV